MAYNYNQNGHSRIEANVFSMDKEDLWEATPKIQDLFEAVKSLYLVNIDSPKDGLVEIFCGMISP